MSAQQSFHSWTSDRRDIALDLIRIYLGLALVVLGIRFITDPQLIQFWLFDEQGSVRFVAGSAIAHYVALTHIIGGFTLMLGLFTRVSALAQLPILFGAVFMVHLRGGLMAADQSLELAALVLFLLAVFSVVGGGRWSVDQRHARPAMPEEDENAIHPLLDHVAAQHRA